MSKKIHFSLCIETPSGDDGFELKGAAARNALQAIYGQEFCIVLDTSDGDTKYLLTDRQAITASSNASIIGNNQPAMHTFNPVFLSQTGGGLYIHKSVMARLEANLQHWKVTSDLFMAEYGFSAPAPLKEVVEELTLFNECCIDPDSAYAGVVFWG